MALGGAEEDALAGAEIGDLGPYRDDLSPLDQSGAFWGQNEGGLRGFRDQLDHDVATQRGDHVAFCSRKGVNGADSGRS